MIAAFGQKADSLVSLLMPSPDASQAFRALSAVLSSSLRFYLDRRLLVSLVVQTEASSLYT